MIGLYLALGCERPKDRLVQKTFLFLSLAVLTSNLAAQQPDEALENILVTTSRTPVPASRVGSSYTVISRADLERRQIVRGFTILNRIVLQVPEGGSTGGLNGKTVRQFDKAVAAPATVSESKGG